MFDFKTFLAKAPSFPGIYLMHNEAHEILYVGKAKNLKKRLSSYFKKKPDHPKTQQLVKQIDSIEMIVTSSEKEALILENNLIKKHHPKYNILFRDDKSYPFIFLSKDIFPRLAYVRSVKKNQGDYFGPYPNSASAKAMVRLLQKIFKIRTCKNNFCKHRQRPCLQYQIQRCAGPCADFIDQATYQDNIKAARQFLKGKSERVVSHFLHQMSEASSSMDYEKAAAYRDQIQMIRDVQSKQVVSTGKGDWDIVVLAQHQSQRCVNLMIVRGGQVLGNRAYSVGVHIIDDERAILTAFLSQYYLNDLNDYPKQIILSHPIEQASLLQNEISKKTTHVVTINRQAKGDKKQLIALSMKNGLVYLQQQLVSKATMLQQWRLLQEALALRDAIVRIECFDVSHTSGSETVTACVVFNQDGAVKQDYRRFNIKDITPGDDYAALKQALMRRYAKLISSDALLPDLVIIDGGKGQLKQAETVFSDCQINNVMLLAIAKGVERKSGHETLFISGRKEPLHLSADNIAFHLIQKIRDEAHRFAITGHRMRRAKAQRQSVLEETEGVGQKRRQALLRYFGGLQGLSKASQADIAAVTGISADLAKKIYTTIQCLGVSKRSKLNQS